MGHQLMPTAAGLTGEDGDSFGRMARGSAGVAEIVHLMEFYPETVVTNIETFAMRKAGVFHAGQAWSMEAIAAEHIRKMVGHRTLQKTIVILAHGYELCRQRPSAENLHIRAFLGQSLKAAFDASNAKGSWSCPC